ncbi:MAG: alpha-2-macroglobulin, partial [Bacteroidota bacterium]
MKHYLTILMIILFATLSKAQDKNSYPEQWKKVEQLENEGLTASALDVVTQIHEQALNDNNSPQRIKSLIYLSRYALTLEENAQLSIVTDFKAEIERSDLVTRHLLENLLATMYWQYFQQNRYKFYNRTKTAEKVDDDFRTWDLETLFNEINTYYKRSLENGLLLQQEKLEDYSDLLISIEGSKEFRPTLFDLLSHNALTFYKTDENSITKPAYQFTIDNETFLSDGDQFMNLNIASKDSSSLQLQALKIYQNLLKLHHRDKAEAYVAVNIERLNYIKSKAVIADKDNLFVKTLQDEADNISSSPLSGLYLHQIARSYRLQGTFYGQLKPDDTYRWKLKKAIEICESVIEKFPESEGAKRCEVLMQQISRPNLQLQTEQFIPVQKPSRILVKYSNLDSMTMTLYKVSKNDITSFSRLFKPNEKLAFLKKLDPFDTWINPLKNEGDYQSHTTELIIPKLDNGQYIMLSSIKNDENTFATAIVQVTDFALIEHTEDHQVTYQVIDRNNGQPLENINIELTYNLNGTKGKKSKTFKTDAYGRFV